MEVRARAKMDVELHSQKKCLSHLKSPDHPHPPPNAWIVSPLSSRWHTQPCTRKSATVNGRGRSLPCVVREGGGGVSAHPHANRSASRALEPSTVAREAEHPGSTGTSFMQLQQCGPRASASGEGGTEESPGDRQEKKGAKFTGASSLSPCSCRKGSESVLFFRRIAPPPVSAPSPVRSAGRAPRLAFEPSVGSAVLALHILGPTLDAPLVLRL